MCDNGYSLKGVKRRWKCQYHSVIGRNGTDQKRTNRSEHTREPDRPNSRKLRGYCLKEHICRFVLHSFSECQYANKQESQKKLQTALLNTRRRCLKISSPKNVWNAEKEERHADMAASATMDIKDAGTITQKTPRTYETHAPSLRLVYLNTRLNTRSPIKEIQRTTWINTRTKTCINTLSQI